MATDRTSFAQTPLITPQRLHEDWRSILALSASPAWVQGLEPIHTDVDDSNGERCPDEVVLVLGTDPARKGLFKLSTVAFAVCLEVCRYGHACGVNINNSNPPRKYAQFIFGGDGWNANEAIGRVLEDAGPGEVVRPLHAVNDLNPENLRKQGGGRASRQARAVAIHHAERLAAEQLSDPERVAAYVANLAALFAHYDAVCASLELTGRPRPLEGEEV